MLLKSTLRYSLYLLSWYKSTNTDTWELLSSYFLYELSFFYLLSWYKSTNTDTWELLSSYFPPKTIWRSFYCAIVAAITLRGIDPLHSGKLVYMRP